MIRRFKNFMNKLPPYYVLLLGLALVALIWLYHHRFGADMACSIYYLLPIGLVVWYVGGSWAVIMPVLAAMAALQADVASMDIFRQPYSPYWEAVARFVCYLVITHLLVLRRKSASAILDKTNF